MRKTLCFVVCLAGSTTITAASAFIYGQPNSAPPAAAAHGYNVLTFNSGFAPALLDTAQEYTAGKEWYMFNAYYVSPTSTGVALNGDGSLTLTGQASANWQVSTTGIVGGAGSSNWTGTAFGGGGYFEAVFKFDPAEVHLANGWPSFWSTSIESMAYLTSQQWAGQATGYYNAPELDFFEYEYGTYHYPYAFATTLHHRYGIYDVTCRGAGYCDQQTLYPSSVRDAPSGIDWTQYHKVAALWIPATPTRSGSVTTYVDGVQVGAPNTWTQFANQAPPPTSRTSWTYGIIDQRHMAIILGTGTGQHLTIKSVKVWQASGAHNLVR